MKIVFDVIGGIFGIIFILVFLKPVLRFSGLIEDEDEEEHKKNTPEGEKEEEE